jgi:hypothetical protein
VKGLVVTGGDGRILATVAYPVQSVAGANGLISFVAVPLKDQRIYVVEIPGHLDYRKDMSRLHPEHKVVGEGEYARLDPGGGTPEAHYSLGGCQRGAAVQRAQINPFGAVSMVMGTTCHNVPNGGYRATAAASGIHTARLALRGWAILPAEYALP